MNSSKKISTPRGESHQKDLGQY